MNAPINPIDLSAGADLSALLQLLVNPVATKQRLDELLAQENSAKASIAELNAMEAETKRLHNTAAATNIVSENRKAALDAREAEADDREAKLQQSESTRADAALKRREDAVQAREYAARAEADRLAVLRKDLEARLSKIKTFSSSL